MTEPSPIDLAGFPGLHAQAEGEQRRFPLLMLHGVLFDHRDFATYCRYFSTRGYDCFAFARRGRAGLPPLNADGVRLRDYMEDTVRVIEAIGRRPAVIGHSLGALLAQRAAEEDRCSAIVLLAPTPPRGVAVRPPASALPFYVKAVPAMLRGRPHLPRREVVGRVAFQRMPEDQRHDLYERMVPESGMVLREVALGVPVDRNKVRCPVLTVGGGADGVYPPRVVQAVARHYAATCHVYPDNDHWIMDEPGWEKPARDIADWLDGLSPDG